MNNPLRPRLLTVLVVILLPLAIIGHVYAQVLPDPCLTPLVDDEPLCNPSVAPTQWPISHRGAYAQGSSPFAGPVAGQMVVAQHIDLTGPPITLAMSPVYTDGHYALWGAELGLSGAVVKIDSDTFSLIDSYVPADEEAMPPAIPLGVSGAYSVVDAESNFLLGRADFVEIYGDSIPGDRSSPIALIKRVFLPASAFCRDDDVLVGGVMLPDRTLALVSEQATVSIIPAEPSLMEASNVVSLPSENGADCTNLSIPSEDLETVSNSIAADENGGIYVVTDAAVIKYQWDGTTLTKVWRTPYDSDPPYSVLRLGPGSGSTPSLMGTALDDDRFVVITDGQTLMHLVLMWRDDIPVGWQPIAPGKDPRIACEVPVTFGRDNAFRSLSEQSVLVRGYSSVVVSNLLASEVGINKTIPAVATAIAALRGGNPILAPHGAQRIDWDPATRTCKTVWVNRSISLPNAIPTMSATTGLMYAIGQRDGVWGLEALDYDTGASVRFDPSAQVACSQAVLDAVDASVLGPFLTPELDALPRSCENSLFAATEVGPDGTIYTGTFQGVSRFVPDSVATGSPKRSGAAGAAQGTDVAARALAALPSSLETAHEMAKRGQTQLATALAVVGTSSGADIDASSAAGATTALSAAIAHFAAADSAVDSDITLAGTEFAAAAADAAEALDWLTPCPPAPQADCRVPAEAAFALKVEGEKSKLKWRWTTKAASTTVPDPSDRAGYALCVYDADGSNRVAQVIIPSSPTAWKAIPDGFKFKDKALLHDGTKVALIKEKATVAIAKLMGRGPNVPSPALPLTASLTVQMVNSETGLCWDAQFDSASIKRNDGVQVKAKVKN